MVGIALSNNILLMLVFWELTSLSSFLLIGFWRDRADARLSRCHASCDRPGDLGGHLDLSRAVADVVAVGDVGEVA